VRAVAKNRAFAKKGRGGEVFDCVSNKKLAVQRRGARMGIGAKTTANLILATWVLMATGRVFADDTPAAGSKFGDKTSFADVISNASPTVVSVLTRQKLHGKLPAAVTKDPDLKRFLESAEGKKAIPEEMEGIGSGVVVSPDGFLLTNTHVVDGADEITITTADKKEFKAKVVGTDPPTDIAVLKINSSNLPCASFADSSKCRVGDVVLAIGDPFGVGQTVTAGIISATQRGGLGISDYEDFIQTDASINPGNSGGALVDAEGRVIGINTAILSRGNNAMGIGFAIPSNLARAAMKQIITNGKVVRGYLGVVVEAVPPDLGQVFKLKPGAGVLVTAITPDSPAAHAGVEPGDIISEVDGKTLEGVQKLRVALAETAPGSRMALKLVRVGKETILNVALGKRPAPRKSNPGRPQKS
jgi:Do/DeqQ family serine protease